MDTDVGFVAVAVAIWVAPGISFAVTVDVLGDIAIMVHHGVVDKER